MRMFLAIAVLAVVAMVVPAGANTIISNGGFEEPPISPNTTSSSTPTGWNWYYTSGWPGMIVNAESGPQTMWFGSTPGPEEGQQYVAIGDFSAQGIYQSFTISSAGNYTLAWYDSCYYSGGVSCSPYTVAITDSSQHRVNPASNFSPIYTGAWLPETITTELTQGTYTLSFLPTGCYSQVSPLIDNVSLAPVPEPATMALLAFGVIGMLRRKDARG